MNEYPWLLDELIKVDGRFKAAKSPVGKIMLKNATVADICKFAKVDEGTLLENLEKFVKDHENK